MDVNDLGAASERITNSRAHWGLPVVKLRRRYHRHLWGEGPFLDPTG
ncbi:MAG TPA: hypothetical protein VKG82_11090 [Solirubrobacteraceae bacterium]|nr:hypothetical protein [Solirubrobacteraceae bacterium]